MLIHLFAEAVGIFHCPLCQLLQHNDLATMLALFERTFRVVPTFLKMSMSANECVGSSSSASPKGLSSGRCKIYCLRNWLSRMSKLSQSCQCLQIICSTFRRMTYFRPLWWETSLSIDRAISGSWLDCGLRHSISRSCARSWISTTGRSDDARMHRAEPLFPSIRRFWLPCQRCRSIGIDWQTATCCVIGVAPKHRYRSHGRSW